MTEAELAWIAGIIDGEGCLYLSRETYASGKVRFHTRVNVRMTHEPTIDRLMSLSGVGYKSMHLSKNPNHKDIYVWRIDSHKTVRAFLVDILPYLFTKKSQADLMIQFIDSTSEIERGDIRSDLYVLNFRGRIENAI